MIEKFKCLLKDGRWPISSQGILISLDDSEDSFDSAAEEDDEEYLNGIFCGHTHKQNFQRNDSHQTHIKQILMKEMHAEKNAAELLQEENQEKLKLERRKERKRRKKERKKAGKEAVEGCNSNNINGYKNSQSNNNKEGVKNNEKVRKDKNSVSDCDTSDDDEDFLDVNSAFVTKVVKHKLRNNANNTGHTKVNLPVNTSKQHSSPIKQTTNGTRLVPIPEKNILLGERLAVAGYQCASKEKYDQAIELFTRALRNVPNDHRYWGNRSFCYFQIGAYQRALEDADCAVQLAPTSPKGHYRRAEALAGLKDLVAAEKSFEKVLELDVECKDACDELLNIRMLRISEMGFDRKQAYYALKKYSSLEGAVDALMNNEKFEVESDEDENLIYQSDEEINWDNVGVVEGYIGDHEDSYNDVRNIEFHNQSFSEQPTEADNFENYLDSDTNKMSKKQAAMDPSNPHRCVSIWVGNIEECVSEKTINEEFSRFGEILSIKMLPSSHCAFINFKDSRGPGPAMAAMQGKDFAGKKLIIRYPNKTKEEQHIHQQMLCHQKRWQSNPSENESECAGVGASTVAGFPPSACARSGSGATAATGFGASAGASAGMATGGGAGATGGYVTQSISSKTTLVPSTKGTRIKLKGPVNGDECYYWRTTGCAFGDKCRNKHIKENRGIDRKPWHK